MTNTKVTHDQYISFIKQAIANEGYKIADTANKLALEIEAITLDMYCAAARIILDAYYAESWKDE